MQKYFVGFSPSSAHLSLLLPSYLRVSFCELSVAHFSLALMQINLSPFYTYLVESICELFYFSGAKRDIYVQVYLKIPVLF